MPNQSAAANRRSVPACGGAPQSACERNFVNGITVNFVACDMEQGRVRPYVVALFLALLD